MLKRRVKTLVLSIIAVIPMLLFTGCGDEKIEAFLRTDLIAVMESRVSANKAIVANLCTSGLISESEKKTIEDSIDKQMGAYMTSELAESKELTAKLLGAVVDWSAPAWSDSNAAGYTKEEWEDKIVTTYIAKHNLQNYVDIPLFKGAGSTVTPISIIDGETGETINERFGYKVFVLKPFSSTASTDVSTVRSLDEVLAMVSDATKNKDSVNNDVLDKLFQEAKDSNNNSVTLLDISKRENQVVGYSKGSTVVSDSVYGMDNGKLKETTVGNKVTAGMSVNNVSFHTPTNAAAPGHDMVISDSTNQIPLMTVRFNEFNSEAVDNIIKTLGMSPDQYLFTTYAGVNRVYIMEYPVNYIQSFKDKDDDASSYESVFDKSNMGINLRTGKLIKYGKAWGVDTDPGVYFEDSEPYLSVKGAANAQEEGQSAFVIEGETPDDAGIEIGETKAKVKTGRIILRDYLETSYAPGVVSGENMVVFGRKLRVLNFSGSKNNVVAKYYDKDGKLIPDSASLSIADFADFGSLNGDNPEIKYIGRIGEEITEPDTTPPEDTGDYTIDTIKKSLSKIDSLDKSVVASIEPSVQFPGTTIGIADNNNNTKPLFYGLAVKKNMFDTGLFSGWITSTDTTKNSLDWWIGWLGNSNRNYNYKINKTTLEDYLIGNYTFEMQKAGVIILDLETVSKIQQEYEQQDKTASIQWYRTVFVILGYALICYTFILLLAWVIDVNVDFGFGILEKASFGHWVAVKEMDNTYEDLGERKYLTFRGIIVKVLIIATVGVLLVLINVMDIVVGLIGIFGGIAEVIGGLITGIE